VEKLIIYMAVGYPGYARPELPAIPKSWDDLVEQIVAGREAGASIVQFRGPDVEGHIAADRWGRLVEQVRRHSDILISFGQAGPRELVEGVTQRAADAVLCFVELARRVEGDAHRDGVGPHR